MRARPAAARAQSAGSRGCSPELRRGIRIETLVVDLGSASLHTAKAVAASTPLERRQRHGPSGWYLSRNSKQFQPAENEFLGGQLPDPRSGWVQENEGGDGDGREGFKDEGEGGKAKVDSGRWTMYGGRCGR